MKKILFTLLVALIGLVDTINAQTNPKISIQGILREANGIAVPDAAYDLTLRIYDDINANKADHIFEEEHLGVQVVNGVYSLNMGSNSSLGGLPFDQTYYVGVQVGTTELLPRIELTRSPYAMSTYSVTCSGAVGDIKYSILDWNEFQEVNGDCWVQMNGQSIPSTSSLNQNYGFTNVPDMSGLFIRAHEWVDGNDPDRLPGDAVATIQGEEIKSHSHNGTTDNATSTMSSGGSHTHNVSMGIAPDDEGSGGASSEWVTGTTNGIGSVTTSSSGSHSHTMNPHNHTFTTNSFGGAETRPKNMNFYIYIRVN